MRPPCELIQKEYLPAVRASLSKSLSEEGFSQTEIAEHLEITQAAVSKYLRQKHESSLPVRIIDDVTRSLVKEILSEESSSDVLIRELCSACMSLRVGSHICTLHQKRIQSLKESQCQICSELLGGEETFSERARVLDDMQKALRSIQKSDSFDKVMPQVRANLVACDTEARTPDDVVGIPGRILIVDGFPRVLSGPQFGASGHTAKLLLWAKGRFPSVRSCLCISGRNEVVESAKSQGFSVLTLDESSGDVDDIAMHAEKLLGSKGKKIRLHAIHVPGGIGIEPILYLFGSSAIILSELCLAISSSL